MISLVGGLEHLDYFSIYIYTHIYIYIGNNHPNWLSYFSEGLKPSTSSFLGRIPVLFIAEVWKLDGWWSLICIPLEVGYGSIPINTIFRGMNIHLPAILMFTRGTRFWHTGSCLQLFWRWETHRNTMSVASKPASQHCHCFATLVPAAQWRCSWGGQHHDILRYTNVVADPALGQFCIGCCEKLLVGCQAAGAIMILDFGSSWWFSPPICPSNDDGADYVTPNWRICILVLICQFWQQSAVLFYGDCKMYPNFRAPLCTLYLLSRQCKHLDSLWFTSFSERPKSSVTGLLSEWPPLCSLKGIQSESATNVAMADWMAPYTISSSMCLVFATCLHIYGWE